MKRLLLAVVLAAVALAGILGYASSRREQTYRRLIEQGDSALQQADSVAAVEAFTVAIALKPGSMLGYLKRGEAYRQYGELENALKDLRAASQLDPSATRPLELLGDVEHALGRYDRAAGRYEDYVSIDDRSPRVLYKLALARYHDNKPAGAVEALRAAIKIDDRFAPAHYLMGLCLETLKKPEAARAALQRAIQFGPALLDAREALATLHHRHARTEDRIAELEALRALDPGAVARHVALGVAHAEAGQFDRAAALLSKAVEQFPNEPYTYVALGRVWLDLAVARSDDVALQKAIEALERGTAADASSEGLMLLGRSLLLAGQADRAAGVLVEATNRRPIDPLAFWHLADAAERIGNLSFARQALLDYHTLEGDPAEARRRLRLFDRLGDLSTRLGEPAGAVVWFQRALAADPSGVDAAVLVRLADAQWRAGDTAGARETVARALEKDPGHRAARALLRKF